MNKVAIACKDISQLATKASDRICNIKSINCLIVNLGDDAVEMIFHIWLKQHISGGRQYESDTRKSAKWRETTV
jgi:hypothetical protein